MARSPATFIVPNGLSPYDPMPHAQAIMNGVSLYITIDTEEDSWGDYSASSTTVENVLRIPLIQEIFDAYGAYPTYLVSYPVACDDRARGLLLDILSQKRCEIGTHCHPWNTPPFMETINEHHSMLSNLPEQLVFRKMDHIHHKIAEKFSTPPVCFRAGRWGFGEKVARSLNQLGYRIDTSITPFIDWSGSGGPDFRHTAPCPYRFNPENITGENPNGSLLEVPASIGFFQRDFRISAMVMRWLSKKPFPQLRMRGLLDRLGLLNLRWLSPELSDGPEMIRLAKNLMRLGYRHLNLSFHSTALLPGSSPFVKTSGDLHVFLHNVRLFLDFCVREGVAFRPLSGALEAYSAAEYGMLRKKCAL